MTKQPKRKQWIYMIGDLGAVKVNSEKLVPLLEGHGLQRCSYSAYLVKKREFGDGQEVEIDGVAKSPMSIHEEMDRR